MATSKVNANGEWKVHKYYYKLDLPGGGSRYFYTKAEYDAYLGEGGNSENQSKNPKTSHTYPGQNPRSSTPRSGLIESRKDSDRMTDTMVKRFKNNGDAGNMPGFGTTGEKRQKNSTDYSDSGAEWFKKLFGGNSTNTQLGTHNAQEKSWLDKVLDDASAFTDNAKKWVNNLLGTSDDEIDTRKKDGASAASILGDKKASSNFAKDSISGASAKKSGENGIISMIKDTFSKITSGKSDNSEDQNKRFSLENVRSANNSKGVVIDAKGGDALHDDNMRDIKTKISGEHSSADDLNSVLNGQDKKRIATNYTEMVDVYKIAASYLLRQYGYDITSIDRNVEPANFSNMLDTLGISLDDYVSGSKQELIEFAADNVDVSRVYHESPYNSLLSYEDFSINYQVYDYINNTLTGSGNMMVLGGDGRNGEKATIIVKGDDGKLYNVANGQVITVMNLTRLLDDVEDVTLGMMSMDQNDIDWDHMLNYITPRKVK